MKITHALSRARKRLTELSDNAGYAATSTKKQKSIDDSDKAKAPRRTSYQESCVLGATSPVILNRVKIRCAVLGAICKRIPMSSKE